MSGVVLAFDIGGTSIKYSLVDPKGMLRKVYEVPTHAMNGGAAVIDTVMDIADTLYPDFEEIAVSTAGQVDSENGIIIYANENIPHYTGLHVRGIISDHFHGMPVFVENDVNCVALGENCYGAGRGYRNYLCLTFGTGIGGAIIIDGRLYKGKHSIAGEFGHFTLYPNGRLCACGLYGCFEQYASVNALVRRVKERCGDNSCSNGRDVFVLMARNNAANEEVDNWIDDIIRGIANLVNIFDPECVIVGGGIMKEPYIIQKLRKDIPSRLLETVRDVKIIPAMLGNSAGLLGAYSLCDVSK